MHQGARVALDRNHESPAVFEIMGPYNQVLAVVSWDPVDNRTQDSWNRSNSTEHGACACVIAALELVEGLLVVRRADRPTGADYYVAPPRVPIDDMENQLRLEVSGCDRDSSAGVFSRLGEKLEQLRRGQSNLPAIAGVVGFRAQIILLRHLEES